MPPIPRPEKPIEDQKPRCPYCGMRPCRVAMRLVAFADAPAAIFFCGNCEKILTVAPIPQVPAAPPQRDDSRILIPQ